MKNSDNIHRLSFLTAFFLLCSIFTFIYVTDLEALPIGFGRHQGDLNYDELVTDDFKIYFDERTPEEAYAILNALTAAKPKLENWLGAYRNSSLPVIMSATTRNASFANFVTDALELQTFGRGDRDLAWHELTHNIMYLHLKNIFGPTGAILHLPWMPAWMIEGLAEATSRSSGSHWQAGIERYYATHGNWPSYTKLHNLYRAEFAEVGYAISGAFVSYMLARCGTKKLPQFFEDFYDYTMPWYWAWTVVPFSGFMPFDKALQNYCGLSGEQMYEEYKKSAAQYWRSSHELTGHFLPKKAENFERILHFSNEYSSFQYGPEIYTPINEVDRTSLTKLVFDTKSKAAKDNPRIWAIDAERSRHIVKNKSLTVTTKLESTNDRKLRTHFFMEEELNSIFFRPGYLRKLALTKTRLFWLETNLDMDQVCYVELKQLKLRKSDIAKQIKCPISYTYPQKLSFLGTSENKDSELDDFVTETIWLKLTEETLLGNRYSIIELDMRANRSFKIPVTSGGEPLSFAKAPDGEKAWGLYAAQNRHVIRQIDSKGRCVKQAAIANVGTRIFAPNKNEIVISSWEDNKYLFYKIPVESLSLKDCERIQTSDSPLLYALNNPNSSFDDAIKATNTWHLADASRANASAENNRLTNAPLIHESSIQEGKPPVKRDAAWRGRPVFGFPWVAVGPKGQQWGLLSVPLMDHMQNETISASTLYGTTSRFPSIQLSLNSTRFETGIGFDLFRQQVWNGSKTYKIEGSEQLYQSTLYYEQIGGKIRFSRAYPASRFLWTLGFTASQLKPLYGPGFLWEDEPNGDFFSIDAGIRQSFSLPRGDLSLNMSGSSVPGQINPSFAYNRIDVSLDYSLGLNWFNTESTQLWGFQFAGTRGAKPRNLKEVYRPLKTFVPGSGGGLNEIHLNLFGLPYLTSGTYGDTKSRLKFAWTFPLVKDLEQMIHIVYLERLDFTSFVNYGRAWEGDSPPGFDQFIAAHGYNLDLQADVKGVSLNMGLGVGQVVGYPFEVYFLFGFDTLINQ